MIYKTIYSDLFLDHFEKLTQTEQKLIESKIEILKTNLDYRSLRTQKLRGTPQNRYESSANMDIRLIWQLDGDTILFEDVGHHDILRKYG